MSNTLNEKFEEFATAQADVLKEYQDPMPTVTATVVPGEGSDPSQVSGDPQQKSSGKDEPSGSSPSVPPSVANGQSVTDLGKILGTILRETQGQSRGQFDGKFNHNVSNIFRDNFRTISVTI